MWLFKKQKDMSDEDLVRQVQLGNQASFETLYNRHGARLLQYATRILGRQQAAEDSVQDIFIAVHAAIPSFRMESKFTTWLYAIATRILARNLGDIKKYDGQENVDGELHQNPDKKLWLEQAIAKLPEGYRNVILLHDQCGFKHEEIAVILNIKASTARSQLTRARLKLRDLLLNQRKEPLYGKLGIASH